MEIFGMVLEIAIIGTTSYSLYKQDFPKATFYLCLLLLVRG